LIGGVGSKTFDGVWFIAYSHDHPPAHVHGSYAETILVVDVNPDGTTALSNRPDAVQPGNAKQSDRRRILKVAAAHGLELWRLWEATRGIH
jgi:hypothetical protein